MAVVTKSDDGLRWIQKTVTIVAPVAALYEMWCDFESFPHFMKHVESVTVSAGGRSHWVVRAPGGTTMEWDAQTIDQQQNELISWRSLAGSEIENGGEVRFRPAPVGPANEVQVRLFYRPPGSSLGAAVAKLFGEEPSLQLDEDLYRFKQLAETGRIPTVDGQPVGGKQLEERNREREQNVRPVQPETREELRP